MVRRLFAREMVALLGRCVEEILGRLQEGVNRFLSSSASHPPGGNPAVGSDSRPQPCANGNGLLLGVRVVGRVMKKDLLAEFQGKISEAAEGVDAKVPGTSKGECAAGSEATCFWAVALALRGRFYPT